MLFTSKKVFVLFLTLYTGLSFSQSFTPFHSYGVQANILYGGTNADVENDSPYAYAQERDTDIGFNVSLSYNYVPLKWLGLSSGLGIHSLGVNNLQVYENSIDRNIYHLNIPLLINFKVGFFTFETGIDNRFFVGMTSKVQGDAYYHFYHNNPKKEDLLTKSDMYTYHLAGSVGGRFRIYEGLSINLGFSMSLTDIARHKTMEAPVRNIDWNNMNYFLGLRYVLKKDA
jgi:hypothetical protein